MKRAIVFVLIGVAIGSAAAYLVLTRYLTQKTATELEQSVEQNPFVESLAYEQLSVSPLKRHVDLTDAEIRLVATQQPFRVGRIQIFGTEFEGGIPIRGRLEMQDIYLPRDHELLQPLAKDLSAMGYEQIRGDLTLRYTYQIEEKQISLEQLILDVPDMGRVEFSLALSNFNLQKLLRLRERPDAAGLLSFLPLVSVSGAAIRFDNATLAQKLVTRTAEKQKISESDLIAQWRSRLAEAKTEAKSERVRSVVNALDAFARNQQQIAFRIDPPQPVALMQFLWVRQPADVIELLHLAPI